jgi:hypothetical protein
MEYAVLIIIIAAALWASQLYLKRALQGHYRQAATNLGQQCEDCQTFTNIFINHEQNATFTTSVVPGGESGWIRQDAQISATQVKYGNEYISGP